MVALAWLASPERRLFVYPCYQPIRCICDGRYKLSINLMTGDELYDLETDPAEM